MACGADRNAAPDAAAQMEQIVAAARRASAGRISESVRPVVRNQNSAPRINADRTHGDEAGPPSPEAFLLFLQRSKLLSEKALADVERLAGELPESDDARRLAAALIARRLLTAWQARMLLAGRMDFFLGRYKLLEKLGAGGMGSVYRAEQQPLERIVALKVMLPDLIDSDQALARFRREIRAAASLDHPNIVRAYDADSLGRTHFLVMEYVQGEDLSSLLARRGRLPVPEACEYIRQAACGLQHACERGMVHRDIKPANLLVEGGLTVPVEDRGSKIEDRDPRPALFDPRASALNSQTRVKILDFGLARFQSETAESAVLTGSHQMMGTVDYVSPEQARDAHHADIRSDIYSLGQTLFRAIAGRAPFHEGHASERLLARLHREAPRLRSLCPEAPEELDALVAEMLARDPQRRIATPAEAVRRLEPFAGQEECGEW